MMASVDTVNPINSNTPYVGNTYVSFDDTIFKGQLQIDLAWSIQDNVDTTGLAAYIKKNKATKTK